MKKFPKVTVVTVTFNLIKGGREEAFRQCIESVHNQIYPNIEHLVVDGASTDGTLDVIKEYADKGWIRYVSEPDTGHWNAMNKGAKLAEGKYIIYLNSDGFFTHDNVLGKCIDVLEENGDDCYCVANYSIYSKDGKPLEHLKSVRPAPKETFYRGQTYNHETLVCPKKIYEKLGYHNEKYKTAIDYEFNIKLILNGYKQMYVPEVLTTVRLGGITTTEKCTATQATIDNVYLLYQDIYPWAAFTQKDVENLFTRQVLKKSFLTGVRQRIRQLNLQNIDYGIFDADIRSFMWHIVEKYYLFFFVKFFEVSQYKNQKLYKFFKIIPLLRVKETSSVKKMYLLAFIPLLKIKKKEK